MDITEKEKDELLLIIKKRYGYDFMNYAGASIIRRIIRFCDIHKIENYFDLKHYLVNDAFLFSDFVLQITVNVTEMFRDPLFFKTIKEKVFPALATYSHCKIWHAGCATGEEVYSLAILLTEANLLKSSIYATDINSDVLKTAKEATYEMKLMKDYSTGYLESGGLFSLSDYYTAHYKMALVKTPLNNKMLFSIHNLATDGSFNEFNLIVCRNVLIYFNKILQERVIKLFYESLVPLGYLALGSKESLLFSSFKSKFEIVDQKEKIYRKIA